MLTIYCVSAQIDSLHWQEAEYHFASELPNCEAKVLINYWISGDTVFKGINYKKLYRECVYSDKHVYPDGISFRLGIREDQNGRIYITDNVSYSTEFFLYDFSDWNIGDTLFLNRGDDNITPKIITENTLDSIMLLDGSYAKSFTGFDQLMLINGIGFTKGFLFPIAPYSGSYMGGMIVSFYKGDKLIWKNPDYVDLKNLTPGNAVKAYTSEGRLIVEVPDNANRLEVYSVNGIFRQNYFTKFSQVIKTSPLPTGMYIYQLIDKNGSVISRAKMVIH
jgi:hypothetical protein